MFKHLVSLLTIYPLLFMMSCKDKETKTDTDSTTDTTTNMNTEPRLKEENVTYTTGQTGDSVVMDGYIVYDEAVEGKRPAVLVVHEWWGLNEYPKMRAQELAKLGYVAMAVDIYGQGKRADNPTDAGKLAEQFYKDPQLAKTRFDAAVRKLMEYEQVDTAKMAGIGYCFGGGLLLNIARLGEDLNGVVSFHGSLLGTPARKDLLKTKILVCHGAADNFVPEADIAQFKKQMDSIGADYKFIAYPNAVHAFTNPNATAMGEKFNIPIRYDSAADKASWQDMKNFFADIFR
jgi:dienelactone hydrolase